MKTISKRLERLERALVQRAGDDADWGGLASTRDQILHFAESRGESHVAEIKIQLDSLGPYGLWLEAVRGWLKDHGFVQTSDESFAETMARALDIGIDELRIRIAHGQIASALLERFGEA